MRSNKLKTERLKVKLNLTKTRTVNKIKCVHN